MGTNPTIIIKKNNYFTSSFTEQNKTITCSFVHFLLAIVLYAPLQFMASYYLLVIFRWVSDCCLATPRQVVSYIMAATS